MRQLRAILVTASCCLTGITEKTETDSLQRCPVTGQKAPGHKLLERLYVRRKLFPMRAVQPWVRHQRGGGISVLEDIEHSTR